MLPAQRYWHMLKVQAYQQDKAGNDAGMRCDSVEPFGHATLTGVIFVLEDRG